MNTESLARRIAQISLLPAPPRGVAVVAVDLTADEGRTSAGACLRYDRGRWHLDPPPTPLNRDAEIIALAGAYDRIALDGPRRPPQNFRRFVARGETPPADTARSRPCEREHLRRVGPIFFSTPVATLGMQRWMTRAWGLFAALDHAPLEIFPSGAFVAVLNGIVQRRPHGLPAKTTAAGRAARIAILTRLLDADVAAFVDHSQGNEKSHDRIDAAMGAVVAACQMLGCAAALGDDADGFLVVPDVA